MDSLQHAPDGKLRDLELNLGSLYFGFWPEGPTMRILWLHQDSILNRSFYPSEEKEEVVVELVVVVVVVVVVAVV